MKIKFKEYSIKEDKYIKKEEEVIGKYKYLKDGDELSCIKDKIYYCIGYDEEGDLVIIDETKEPYCYPKEDFEKVEDTE